MRILVSVLALAIVIGFSSAAYAAKGNKAGKADKPVTGKVVKVDGTNLVINKKSKAGEQEVTVAVDKDAKITVNGVAGTLNDLKPDMKVKVTGSGAAQTIEGTSGRAGKKNK